MRRLILKHFRIVDADSDFFGSLIVENGIITNIINSDNDIGNDDAEIVINGAAFGSSAVLMPSFIDLHAHFRDSGSFSNKNLLPSELLESASLAAVKGGFTTIICMANTNPVIDTAEKAAALKKCSDALGLIDLYPVLSLTKNMEGKELSEIKNIQHAPILMFSEDGKDIADDDLFLAAMTEAQRLGIPVSCHCDINGELNAVRRAIALGKKAGCHVHIAHVSTKETVELIRVEKSKHNIALSCEVTPHHIGANIEDARRMGETSFGRVNPPLQTVDNCHSIVYALRDETIDAIATDHAPHTQADKATGAPGFSGLETAFAASCTYLAADIGLQQLSALMSKNPARILSLHDRGVIAKGLRADLLIADTQKQWKVDPEQFKSRGKCSPFTGKELRGKAVMTINAGNIVYAGDGIV